MALGKYVLKKWLRNCSAWW